MNEINTDMLIELQVAHVIIEELVEKLKAANIRTPNNQRTEQRLEVIEAARKELAP